LGWTVDLQKPGYFIGRSALEAEKRRGSEWALIGLVIEWESLEAAYERVSLPPQVPHTAWRQSTPLYDSKGREAGYATSGGFSPMLKRYLALATVRSAYGAPGTRLEMEITVEHMRRRARATVVKTPFFDPPRKKAVPAAAGERTP
jgi:aminomethyltransferase